jgi:hypothetical protein
MRDEILEDEFPGPWPYDAEVVDREDPEGLHRVKVCIPGEIDESYWMFPVGGNGMGGPKQGSHRVPPIGASVLVFFVCGDRENGRYLAGNWGEDEVPDDDAVTSDGDNVVYMDKRLKVEVDSRESTTGVRVSDLATGVGVVVDIDAANRTVGITGQLGVVITSSGSIAITGGTVTINGRKVAPGSNPL